MPEFQYNVTGVSWLVCSASYSVNPPEDDILHVHTRNDTSWSVQRKPQAYITCPAAIYGNLLTRKVDSALSAS